VQYPHRAVAFADPKARITQHANGEQALTVSGPPEPIRLVLVVR